MTPKVSRDLRDNPIYTKGLCLCCIEALKQHSPEHGTTVTQEFICNRCRDRMVLINGVWGKEQNDPTLRF